MKKTVSFRFTDETLSQLGRLSEGTTRTAVLEQLISMASMPVVGATVKVSRQPVRQPVQDIQSVPKGRLDPSRGETVKQALEIVEHSPHEPSTQPTHKMPPLEAAAKTAQKRVDRQVRAAATILAGPPKPVQDISATKQVMRRKINPMTGKPFGAVPK